MAPTLPVNVALITDGQTDIPVGGPVSLTSIGGSAPVTLFQGNVTISGNVITRASGSELGSFSNAGFQAGQVIQVGGLGTFTVNIASALTLTLNASPGNGDYPNLTISRLVNHGLYNHVGKLTFNNCAADVNGNLVGSIPRDDHSSWLDDGFLEGQLFQVNGSGRLYRIQALLGTTSTRVDILMVTAATHDPTTGVESVGVPFANGDYSATLTQWAPQVTFTSANWYIADAIPVVADPYYNVPAGNANQLFFPKVPHLLSSIKGPLSVDGADPGNDHTALQMAVMLPHETNALPFGIGIQPPESQQVNVLNIFDDGSQQDQNGTLSSTVLGGFGMGPGVDFTNHKGYVPNDPHHPTFGEPPVFPSGVSFGSITIDSNGHFHTDASLSTIQVLNLMMGQGNDHLAISGSLVPGQFSNNDGTVPTRPAFTQLRPGGRTQVPGGGAAQLSVTGTFHVSGNAISRDDNLNWADSEFAIGQLLMWNGHAFGMITNVAGNTLTVNAVPSCVSPCTVTIAVFDPQTRSDGSFSLAGSTITRNDLRSGYEFGFAPGQAVTVDGMPVGSITAIGGPSNAVMTVSGTVPGFGGTVEVSMSTNPVRTGGNDITVTGGGGPGPTLTPPTFSGTLTAGTNTLTRSSGSWLTDGFVYGMVLQIGGVPGWTVAGATDSTLLLNGAALTLGAMTIGLATPIIGWAPSPLAVYGGTSQDGIWYSGDTHTMTQRDFATKPFPTQLGNGTPDFIFPVADPFRFFGNNVIDASADFPIAPLPAGTTPTVGVPEGQVPSVGLILYGGPGNNTIYGSQASDFIAGGSGNTTVYGERGRNQILGSDGVNVDVITRAVSFPTINVSVYPNADPLLCGQYACNNLLYGNTPGAGEVVTDRFGDYNNVIFGAMGVVTQDTLEATVGILGATIALKGLTLVSSVATGQATLTCANGTACFQSAWAGLAISDQYGYLGAGTTIASVDSSLTFATLSRNALNGASANNLAVTINNVRSVSGTVTVNPPGTATVSNTVPPGTSSPVATFTCATACFNATDVGLDVSDGNTHLSPGTVIVAVSGLVGGLYTTATLSRNVKDSLPYTGSDSITVGPPHGYCRPTGSQSNSPYCPASGTTPFGDPRLEKLQTTGDIDAIASAQVQNHGNDTLYGSGGDNVLVGGDGNDTIQGGPGRNLIVGGSVALDRTTHLFNYTNPRFQDLGGPVGTVIYNSCSYGTCGNGNGPPANGYAFGQPMNHRTPQSDPPRHASRRAFLSNGGHPGTPSGPSCTAGDGPTGVPRP